MSSDAKISQYLVAFTADFFDSHGQLRYRDVGMSGLRDEPGIKIVPLREFHPVIRPEQLLGIHAAVVMDVSVDANSVSNSEELVAIARFGVGYNDIDVQACTAADVAFFNAAGGVDRSMAEATVGWMIALSHHFRAKDTLVRTGQWNLAPKYVGYELRDHIFGSIGMGGIARATIRLLQGFGMAQPIAYDPYVDPVVAHELGVRMVSLDELMREADFVSVHCPLNDKTRNLVGARELALMKPEAFILNTARGGIVNEDALFNVLQEGRIAGSALDVFVGEPFDQPHRFASLDNVLLAPHAIGHTHEIFRDMGQVACKGVLDIATGRRPKHVINPEVFEKSSFQEKWRRLRL
jgi:phosphoglycerate dehydrogenase-like enzyme